MDSLASLEKMFFGPLDSSYCMIFYVIMVVLFISLVIVSLRSLYTIIFSKKKLGFAGLLTVMGMIAYAALLYFHQRLLYSMCVKSDL